MKTSPQRSHLFTVRVWQEEVEQDRVEWRGKVQLLTSGDVRYFREWNALVPLLLAMLSEAYTTSSNRDVTQEEITSITPSSFTERNEQ